jgi:hypothetical protein
MPPGRSCAPGMPSRITGDARGAGNEEEPPPPPPALTVVRDVELDQARGQPEVE